MAKPGENRGMGWIEWTLIAVLIILALITAFLLLKPALLMVWQNFLESLQ